MLDIVTNPERNSNMLPPDIAPYLLSASPPTSFVSLHTIALSAQTSYGLSAETSYGLSAQTSYGLSAQTSYGLSAQTSYGLSAQTSYSLFPQPPLSQESNIHRVFSSAHRQSSPIKSIMSMKPKSDSDCDSKNENGESSTSEQPAPLYLKCTSEQSSLRINGTSEQSTSLPINGTSEQSAPLRSNGTSEQSVPLHINGTSEQSASVRINCTTRKMKRVSFADNLGRPLAEVRFLVDRPEDPPNFTNKQLSEFTGGKSSDELTKADNDNSNDPPLIVPDPQPIAQPDFLATLPRKMLAVENVYTTGYTVNCSVYVNKKGSLKRVFGRYTVDSWQTHHDTTAHYTWTPRVDFDSYLFSFQVPFSSDRSKNIQFAVCYEEDSMQHWDNNEGRNYRVCWGREPEDEEVDNANPISFKGLAWWYDQTDVGHPYY